MDALPLKYTARLVCVQVLLDLTDSTNPNKSQTMLAHLKTGYYSAIAEDILERLVSHYPQKVTNKMLSALVSPYTKNLNLSKCTGIKPSNFIRIFLNTKNLQCLDLSNCDQMMLPDFFLLVSVMGIQLTSLSVEGCCTVNDEVVHVVLVSVMRIDLTSLSIEGCSTVNDNVVHSILKNLKSLRQLNLSSCRNITDEAFMLNKDLQSNRQTLNDDNSGDVYECSLVTIDVSGCHGITNRAVQNLVTLTGPTLRNVSVSWTEVTMMCLLCLSGFVVPEYLLCFYENEMKENFNDLYFHGKDLANFANQKQQNCERETEKNEEAENSLKRKSCDSNIEKKEEEKSILANLQKVDTGVIASGQQESKEPHCSKNIEIQQTQLNPHVTEEVISTENVDGDDMLDLSEIVLHEDHSDLKLYNSSEEHSFPNKENINCFLNKNSVEDVTCCQSIDITDSEEVIGEQNLFSVENLTDTDVRHLTDQDNMPKTADQISALCQKQDSDYSTSFGNVSCACSTGITSENESDSTKYSSDVAKSGVFPKDVELSSKVSAAGDIYDDASNIPTKHENDSDSQNVTYCSCVSSNCDKRHDDTDSVCVNCQKCRRQLSSSCNTEYKLLPNKCQILEDNQVNKNTVTESACHNFERMKSGTDCCVSDISKGAEFPMSNMKMIGSDTLSNNLENSSASIEHVEGAEDGGGIEYNCVSLTKSFTEMSLEKCEHSESVGNVNSEPACANIIENENSKGNSSVRSSILDINTPCQVHSSRGVTDLTESSDSNENMKLMSSFPQLRQIYKSKLQSIDMTEIQQIDSQLINETFEIFITENQGLQKISLSWSKFPNYLLEKICEALSDLREITLIDCHCIDADSIQKLGSSYRKLRKVELQGLLRMTDRSLMPFLSNPNLESFSLAEALIHDVVLVRMSTNTIKTLKRLSISYCEEVTECGINAVFRKDSCVENLSLRQCAVTDLSLSLLADHFQNLKRIILSSVEGISDNGIVTLSKNILQLEYIDLSWAGSSSLSDKTTTALLSHCSQMNTMILSGQALLTSKPFLSLISDYKQWQRCKALFTFKRKEKGKHGEETFSSDEEYAELCFPRRSTIFATNLQFLSLEYCDRITDTDMEEIVAVARGSLTVVDYYNEHVKATLLCSFKGQ